MKQHRIQTLLAALREDQLVALASELIRIPSVNPKDEQDCRQWGIIPGEGNLVGAIAERLRHCDLEVEWQEVVPGRHNLIARYRGRERGPVLALNAHLDTVGAFEMQERAFRPEVRAGCLYGRGAADMKGALACFILVLEALAQHQIPLAGEVVLTAVIGEEGAPNGSEYLVKHGFNADGAIVGEPSECQIFIGQRGCQFVRLTTRGKTAHGSVPEAGVNAIDQMGKLLVAVPAMDLFSKKDPRYGAPSCSVGTIQGGVRINVVPDYCEATLDVRIPPGILPEDVLAGFRELMRTLGIAGEVKAAQKGHPAYLTPEDTLLTRAAQAAADYLGMQEGFGLAPYWSDMAYLMQAGIPTLVIGPGSILRAHSGNEYVEIEQLVKAARLYALIAVLFCGDDDNNSSNPNKRSYLPGRKR